MKDQLNVTVLAVVMSFFFLLTSNAIPQDKNQQDGEEKNIKSNNTTQKKKKQEGTAADKNKQNRTAQDNPGQEKNWYWGSAIGRGQMSTSFSTTLNGYAVEGNYDETSPTLKVFLGTRFNRFIGIEGSLIYLGSYSGDFVSFSNTGFDSREFDDDLDISGFSTTIDAKGAVPLGEKFKLTGKLGLHRTFWTTRWERTVTKPNGDTYYKEETDTGASSGLTYGLGANLRLSDQFSLRADVRWIEGLDRLLLQGDTVKERVEFDSQNIYVGFHYNF